MKKFKYWLVNFVVEIDSVPLSYMMVVEMPEAITAATCAPLLDRLQKTLFAHWPEVAQDPDEPCANDGTHRQTPWWSGAESRRLAVCIHWKFNQGITRQMAAKLRQAGAAWTKLPI